jgi:plastocyanin
VRTTFVYLALIALAVASASTRAYADSADVHIVNGAPDPQSLTVHDGDTVTFVNDDDVPHAIFAGGEQRGHTIEPHTRSEPFGPFDTAGQGGRSDYQVDENGAHGVILIQSASSTTASTTTTAAPTTTTTTTKPTTTTTKPTTTTAKPSTTTTAPSTTTTTTRPPSSSTNGRKGQSGPSSVWLAVFGGVLVLVGIGNIVRVMLRPKHRRRGQA